MKTNPYSPYHKLALATILLLIVSCIGTGLSLNSCTCEPDAYYIDPLEGNDANSGRTPDKAWKSLERVKELTLLPGEQLLLKRGTTLNGQLEISAQGTAGKPAVVGTYGEETLPKPCIVCDDTSLYAVRVFNSEYVTVCDLEIVNTGKQPLPCAQA